MSNLPYSVSPSKYNHSVSPHDKLASNPRQFNLIIIEFTPGGVQSTIINGILGEIFFVAM